MERFSDGIGAPDPDARQLANRCFEYTLLNTACSKLVIWGSRWGLGFDFIGSHEWYKNNIDSHNNHETSFIATEVILTISTDPCSGTLSSRAPSSTRSAIIYYDILQYYIIVYTITYYTLYYNVYVHMYIYIYIHIHTYTYAYVCMHIFLSLYLCIYLSISISLSLYIYIYIYI